ncbi:MAG: RNA 2',3'-cyclic phosphodiesterase [Candidatus Thermoplasmatota archaeon]|nr:RNA 2',3'-cyclic phosphodiesterase [Candidatus Thermoplasmatota archaeon]
MRLFFSIKAPEHTTLYVCRDALASMDGRFRTVDPALMHITIRFLGEIDADPAGLIDAISGPVARIASFDMYPARAGAFPSWKRPSVLWIGFEDGGRSAELASYMDKALSDLGFPPASKKPYLPHMTLARSRSVSGSGNPRAVCDMALNALVEEGYRIPVTEVMLMGSTLTPQGPIHEVLGRAPLSPGEDSFIR